jgi:hypothetical protein
MRITNLESIRRLNPIHPPNAVLSGRVVPFRPDPGPKISRSTEEHEKSHKPSTFRLAADSYAVTDPVEYFFYWVISGAAVVSVLIGILTLPSADPTKSELLKTGRSQALESSVVVQNRS